MKKKILVLLSCLLVLGTVAGCGANTASSDDNKIVVGATAKPHAEILEVVKPILAEQDIDLEIKVYTDYVLLNPALKDGSIEANFFQHVPYLEDYNAKNDADLVTLVKVHNEPMGVYSQTVENLDELKDGAKVGIPNDATNGGRALLVLEKAGLIKLEDGVGVAATIDDIVDNPKNLNVSMADAAFLPRALADNDICVINSNYAIEAKLNPVTDSIFMEDKDSPYANVLAVRPADKYNEKMQKLAEVLNSQEVKDFLVETYQGSCVPAF